MLPAELRDFLANLEAFGQANDQQQAERSKKMLNLEHETAALVSILIRASKARRILEIGTSNGYSTIWLADAAGPTGRVVSIDRDAEKIAFARENLNQAGLLNRVDLRVGEATGIITGLDGPFDVIFFDGDRTTAPGQLKILLPKLAPSALVLADNVLSHPEEIAGYINMIQSLAGFEHTVVPVGKGLSIACLRGE
ncbi:MAG: class I SAM-dependent methyltransferase [Bryobacteraceae bacterium]